MDMHHHHWWQEQIELSAADIVTLVLVALAFGSVVGALAVMIWFVGPLLG